MKGVKKCDRDWDRKLSFRWCKFEASEVWRDILYVRGILSGGSCHKKRCISFITLKSCGNIYAAILSVIRFTDPTFFLICHHYNHRFSFILVWKRTFLFWVCSVCFITKLIQLNKIKFINSRQDVSIKWWEIYKYKNIVLICFVNFNFCFIIIQ